MTFDPDRGMHAVQNCEDTVYSAHDAILYSWGMYSLFTLKKNLLSNDSISMESAI